MCTVAEAKRNALEVLQAELVGNRALDACVWAVVEATERAYPLLLSASLDKARHTAQQLGLEADVEALSRIWILQVLPSCCSVHIPYYCYLN